jgi:hypothetical protein
MKLSHFLHRFDALGIEAGVKKACAVALPWLVASKSQVFCERVKSAAPVAGRATFDIGEAQL